MTQTTPASQKSPDNPWNAPTYSADAYWTDYINARPDYDRDGFYETIIDYYRKHNTSVTQGVAHDAGTGPGQVAVKLCEYFDKIIASDLDSTHLAVAAQRAEKLGVKEKITWEKQSVETLDEHYPAGSYSLVTAAECFPLLDARRAMNAFAHILQPNGTLAAWFYGRPGFAEPEFAASCQPILDDIIDSTYAKIVKRAPPAAKAGWKRATDRMMSFLDDIEIDSTKWSDVHRYKWNPNLQLSFIGAGAVDFPIEVSSAIDEANEKVISEINPHFWRDMWTVKDVERFVYALTPQIEELKAKGEYLDEHVTAKYRELGEAMGGTDVKVAVTWPVVLILATRK